MKKVTITIKDDRDFVTVRYAATPTHVDFADDYDGTNIKKLAFEYDGTTITRGMFTGNQCIISVKLPETLEKIEKHSFVGCSNIDSITIPKKVILIGRSAFRNCTSLVAVYFFGTKIHIDRNAFEGCTNLIMINLPLKATLGVNVFYRCDNLLQGSPVKYTLGSPNNDIVHKWLKERWNDCPLHPICHDPDPIERMENINNCIKNHGQKCTNSEDNTGMKAWHIIANNTHANEECRKRLQPTIVAKQSVGGFADDPTSGVDRLKYQLYARSLVKVARQAEIANKSSFVVGISAPWGVGKTKLWHLIKKELEKDDNVDFKQEQYTASFLAVEAICFGFEALVLDVVGKTPDGYLNLEEGDNELETEAIKLQHNETVLFWVVLTAIIWLPMVFPQLFMWYVITDGRSLGTRQYWVICRDWSIGEFMSICYFTCLLIEALVLKLVFSSPKWLQNFEQEEIGFETTANILQHNETILFRVVQAVIILLPLLFTLLFLRLKFPEGRRSSFGSCMCYVICLLIDILFLTFVCPSLKWYEDLKKGDIEFETELIISQHDVTILLCVVLVIIIWLYLLIPFLFLWILVHCDVIGKNIDALKWAKEFEDSDPVERDNLVRSVLRKKPGQNFEERDIEIRKFLEWSFLMFSLGRADEVVARIDVFRQPTDRTRFSRIITGETLLFHGYATGVAEFSLFACIRIVCLKAFKFIIFTSNWFCCGMITKFSTCCCGLASRSIKKEAPFLHNHKYIFVEFNAWVYSGSDILWASLMEQLWTKVEAEFGFYSVRLHRASIALSNEDSKDSINLRRKKRHEALFKYWTNLILSSVLAIVGVAFGIYLLIDVHSKDKNDEFPDQGSNSTDAPSTDPIATFDTTDGFTLLDKKGTIGGIAITISPIPFFFQLQTFITKILPQLLHNPIDVIKKYTLSTVEGNRHDFATDTGFMGAVKKEAEYLFDFIETKKKKDTSQSFRLCIFVDDLDRCDAKTVVAVLRAVELLCGKCVTCWLALDTRIVTASIDDTFNNVFEKAGVDGYDFLEKIIQVQFCIPNMTEVKKLALMHPLFLEGVDNLDLFKMYKKLCQLQRQIKGTIMILKRLGIYEQSEWKLLSQLDNTPVLPYDSSNELDESKVIFSLLERLRALYSNNESFKEDKKLVEKMLEKKILSDVDKELVIVLVATYIQLIETVTSEIYDGDMNFPPTAATAFAYTSTSEAAPGGGDGGGSGGGEYKDKDKKRESERDRTVQLYNRTFYLRQKDEDKDEDEDENTHLQSNKALVYSTNVGIVWYKEFKSMLEPHEQSWFRSLARYFKGRPRSMGRVINSYNVSRFILNDALGNAENVKSTASHRVLHRKLLKMIMMAENWPYRMSWLLQIAEVALQEEELETMTPGNVNPTFSYGSGISLVNVLRKIGGNNIDQDNGTHMKIIMPKMTLLSVYRNVARMLILSHNNSSDEMRREGDPKVFEMFLADDDDNLKDLLKLSDIIPRDYEQVLEERITLRPFVFNLNTHMLEKISMFMDERIIHIRKKEEGGGKWFMFCQSKKEYYKENVQVYDDNTDTNVDDHLASGFGLKPVFEKRGNFNNI